MAVERLAEDRKIMRPETKMTQFFAARRWQISSVTDHVFYGLEVYLERLEGCNF